MTNIFAELCSSRSQLKQKQNFSIIMEVCMEKKKRTTKSRQVSELSNHVTVCSVVFWVQKLKQPRYIFLHVRRTDLNDPFSQRELNSAIMPKRLPVVFCHIIADSFELLLTLFHFKNMAGIKSSQSSFSAFSQYDMKKTSLERAH